jgi:hypothetical protein
VLDRVLAALAEDLRRRGKVDLTEVVDCALALESAVESFWQCAASGRR